MKCNSCGADLAPGEGFCRICGTRIYDVTVNSNNQNIVNSVETNMVSSNSTVPNSLNQNPIEQQVVSPNVMGTSVQPQVANNGVVEQNGPKIRLNAMSSDMEKDGNQLLVDTYIGKNADKIKDGKFSINAFILGAIYIFYRKMWLLGFFWLAILFLLGMIIKNFIIYIIVFVLINVIGAIKFKQLYMKNVDNEVAKTRSKYVNTTFDTITLAVKKSGGTSIIMAILCILAVGYIINYTYTNGNTTKKIGNLYVSIPNRFEVDKNNTETHQVYRLAEEIDTCSITLNLKDSENMNAMQYLEKNVYKSDQDKLSEIVTEGINNKQWNSVELTTAYNKSQYHAINIYNQIYEVEFTSFGTNTICDKAYSNLKKSLKFKDND